MIKKILIALTLMAFCGAGYVYYQLHKPPRDINNEMGIVIPANDLSKEYNKDEKSANTKYLDKAIEVSGKIAEIDKNQDGGKIVILETEDPMGVVCALNDSTLKVEKGQNVVIKGFCSGNNMGVSLRGCECSVK